MTGLVVLVLKSSDKYDVEFWFKLPELLELSFKLTFSFLQGIFFFLNPEINSNGILFMKDRLIQNLAAKISDQFPFNVRLEFHRSQSRAHFVTGIYECVFIYETVKIECPRDELKSGILGEGERTRRADNTGERWHCNWPCEVNALLCKLALARGPSRDCLFSKISASSLTINSYN